MAMTHEGSQVMLLLSAFGAEMLETACKRGAG